MGSKATPPVCPRYVRRLSAQVALRASDVEGWQANGDSWLLTPRKRPHSSAQSPVACATPPIASRPPNSHRRYVSPCTDTRFCENHRRPFFDGHPCAVPCFFETCAASTLMRARFFCLSRLTSELVAFQLVPSSPIVLSLLWPRPLPLPDPQSPLQIVVSFSFMAVPGSPF